jgi:HK97 family phage portal protein
MLERLFARSAAVRALSMTVGVATGGPSGALQLRGGLQEQLATLFKAGIELGQGSSLARFREDAYASHATAYTCVRLIAQSGSMMPYRLWRKETVARRRRHGARDPEQEVLADPILDLMENPYPGRYMSGRQFMELGLSYVEAGGNAWVYKDLPNSKGVPRSLQVFSSKHVEPIVGQKLADLQGWKVTLGRTTKEFAPEELLHLKLPDPEDPSQIMGVPPVRAAQYDVDRDSAQNRYDAAFFTRGGVPPLAMVYEPPNVTATESLFLNQEQVAQVMKPFEDRHGGADRAHRPALIHGGFKLQELGASRQDLLSLEGKRWSRQQVAMVYGVPVRLLNEIENTGLSREDLNSALYALYLMTVLPLMDLWSRGLQQYLIEPYNPKLEGAFDSDEVEALLDDYGKKLDHAKTLVGMNYPPNMVNDRLDLGMDRLEWGDDALVSPLLTTAQSIIDSANAEPDPLGPALPQTIDPTAPEGTPPADTPPPSDTPPSDTPPPADGAGDAPPADATAALREPVAQRTESTERLPSWRTDPRRIALWRGYVQSWERLERSFHGKIRQHIFWLRKEMLRQLERLLRESKLLIDPVRSTTRGLEEDLDSLAKAGPGADERIRRLTAPYFERAVTIAAGDVAKTLGRDPVGLESPQALEYLKQKQIKVVEINVTLRAQVRERVRQATLESYDKGLGFTEAAAKVREAIKDVFNNGERRARTIARTEIGDAIQGGRMSEYTEQGVTEHEWVSAQDDEVRRPPDKGGKSEYDHWIDGEVVAVGETFSNELAFPHDPDGDPGNVINCRCTTIPVVGDEPIPTGEED